MSLFLVAVQDLRDVSSTGRWCQGISCCVAEADICRSKELWPEILLIEREREKEEHTPVCVPSPQ